SMIRATSTDSLTAVPSGRARQPAPEEPRAPARAGSPAALARQSPLVGEAGHADVLHPGPDPEGVEPAVVVVGVAVPGVARHVQQVLALAQAQPIDVHHHVPLSLQLPETEPFDRGVGPVAADAVLAEDAEAEDAVLDRPRRPVGQVHGARLPGIVEVPL